MQVVHPRCAGLDVHKDSVVACALTEKPEPDIRTFGTTTAELLALGDWLGSLGVSEVAIESTGVYWKPVWNLLEHRFHLILVNPQHIKQVPGRKTDVCDSQWIADLLKHGLLRPSFVPDRSQRQLRDLTRQRMQLVDERARAANRLQKVLEDANLKLGSVISDILGKSGQQMLRMLVEVADATPEAVAEQALGVLRLKIPQLKEALRGSLNDHHRFMLKQILDHVAHLDQQIQAFEKRIEQEMSPFVEDLNRLDQMPGINSRAAQVMVAEIGVDMSRFPTPEHLASWAGLCPGNNESAGKRRSGKTRNGDRWLKRMLCQCAWAAARTKASYYHQQYLRIKVRRGHKRAVLAVAHSMLVTAWHLLSRKTQYLDLGSNYFQRVAPAKLANHLVSKLQRLGYHVTLSSAA